MALHVRRGTWKEQRLQLSLIQSGRRRPADTGFARTMQMMLRSLPSGLPSGLFSTDRLGAYLRRNMARAGMPDDFQSAYTLRKKGLYLTAVDLNRGELMVFGHDEPYAKVAISDAVRASCALPGWYRPVRIDNPLRDEAGEPPVLDLVDGGLVRTANVRVAVEKGADLVICYNPFARIRYDRLGRSLTDHGPYALASQLVRILLGARLDIAKELLYRDETVDADVIFVEPSEDDFVFFRMNPLHPGNKERAAMHGYRAIRAAIQSSHARLAEVFSTHGIELPAPDAHTPPAGEDLAAHGLNESRSVESLARRRSVRVG